MMNKQRPLVGAKSPFWQIAQGAQTVNPPHGVLFQRGTGTATLALSREFPARFMSFAGTHPYALWRTSSEPKTWK